MPALQTFAHRALFASDAWQRTALNHGDTGAYRSKWDNIFGEPTTVQEALQRRMDPKSSPPNRAGAIDELVALYKSEIGEASYDSFCTRTEHALQSMAHPALMGASERLQLTAFLQEVGLLVQNGHDNSVDLVQEVVGCEYLTRLGFGPEITEPIKLCVAAKRYLCAVEAEYLSTLSDGSRRSLEQQGGAMSTEEVQAYESNHGKFGEDAAQLRKWKDDVIREDRRESIALNQEMEDKLRQFARAAIEEHRPTFEMLNLRTKQKKYAKN